MEAPVLRVIRRSQSGKGVARKIRAEGMIPAILYGGGENISLSLQPQELLKILNSGENTIFHLEIDGDVGSRSPSHCSRPATAPSQRDFAPCRFVSHFDGCGDHCLSDYCAPGHVS